MLAITGDIHRLHRRRHVGRCNAVIVFRAARDSSSYGWEKIHDRSRKSPIDRVIGERAGSNKAIYEADFNNRGLTDRRENTSLAS